MKQTRYALLALVVAGLVGVGVASAHGGFGSGPGQVCDEDASREECRQSLQERKAGLCIEKHGEDFCEAFQALREEQRAEVQELHEAYGIEREPGGFQPPKDGRKADCEEAHGEAFCEELRELFAEHKAERQALFDEYGIEGPPGPHHGPRPGLRR